MKLKMILASALVLGGMTVGYAATYYKVGSDASGTSSFRGHADTNKKIGWGTSKGATALASISNSDWGNHDFIDDGLTLRTPAADSASSFIGQSLTLTNNGALLLKKKNAGNNLDITVSDLRVSSSGGGISHGHEKSTFTLKGKITIAEDATLRTELSLQTTAADNRALAINSTVIGPTNSTIDIKGSGSTKYTQSTTLTLASAAEFYGTITTSSSPRNFTLNLSGGFGGSITSLPSETAAINVYYDGLDATTGLRINSTTIPAVLKNKLRLYSSTTNFKQDGLPLLSFPAGTVVNPADFSIVYSTTASSATTAFHGLKVVTNADDTVVLAVDGKDPQDAKYLPNGEGDFAWHFWSVDGTDVTATCGLTEPNSSITVYFDNDVQYNALKAITYTAKATCVTNFEATADVDLTSASFTWTALSAAPFDLKGHSVNLPTTFFNSTAVVTDTVGGGELKINVASGVTVNNSGVQLNGKLRLVKEGEGTFCSARKEQSYTGGNEVKAGKLTTTAGTGTDTTYSAKYHLLGAEGSEIVVRSGAAFDIAGNYDYCRYHIILDGGTLRSGTATDATVAQTKTTWGGVGWMTLTADSEIYLRSEMVVYGGEGSGPIDLKRHTLTVNAPIGLKYLHWRRDIANGVLRLNGVSTVEEYFKIYAVAVDATTVDVVDNMGIFVEQPFSVRGYNPTRDWDNTLCTGTAALNVYGTFRPDSAYFYGCTMQNCSTLDLSGKAASWSVKSSATKGRTVVTFADNATITVDIGTRQVDSRTAIVSWDDTTRPTNLATLKFQLPDGTRLRKMSDGLYLKPGIVILLQ